MIYFTLTSYFIAFLLTLTLKDIPPRKHEIKKFKVSLKDLKLLKENKKLVRVVVNRILIGVAMSSFILLWQPQFQAAEVPIILFGIFLALGSFGIFIVNRKIEWISKLATSKTLLFISGIIPAIGFTVLGIIFNSIISILTYLIVRIVTSVREPILSQYINDNIKSDKRATTLSLISMLSATIIFILRPIIGALTDISLTIGFVTLSILCFSAIILFPINKDHICNH